MKNNILGLYILVIVSLLSGNDLLGNNNRQNPLKAIMEMWFGTNYQKSPDYMKNIINLKGKPLQIGQLIGDPYSMTCVDTLLIYGDRYGGKSISVFDLKNNRFVGRFISEGQGPNEVIPMLYLIPYSQKDKLYAFQRGMNIINTFDVSNFQIQSSIKIASSLPPSYTLRPNRMQKTKDYYVGVGVIDKGRFGIFDSNGKFLYTDGVYPYQGKDMEPNKAYTLYQGQICASPERNYFAAGCWWSDHIAFYEVTKNGVVLLKEYSSYDTTVDFINMIAIKSNSVLNFTEAFGTADYCYMLFNGKTFAENNEGTRGGNYIIVFDWQGNYIKTFHIDYKAYCFYVDEANNCIYASVLDENLDYVITKLEMK